MLEKTLCPSPYVRCSSLLTILIAFCSTCCSSSVSGEPKLGSIWFSVIYQLAGNAFYLSPQLGSLRRGKAVLAAISNPEETLLVTRGLQKPYKFYWGKHPPVSSPCWHSIWHHWLSKFPLQGNKLHFPKWNFQSPNHPLETLVSWSSESFTFPLLHILWWKL